MEMRRKFYSIFFVLLIISCQFRKQNQQVGDCKEGILTGYEVPQVSLNKFTGKNEVENQAIQRVKEYLVLKKINVDSFFVSYVGYPDTTVNCNFLYDGHYYITISLTHQKTVDYLDSLEKINTKLSSKGGEWPLIIPPVTGNVSGKDRSICYYFRNDSIADILAQ